MFEHLKPFDKIIVTGPQRSGTRICAKMMAHDLGKTYCSEAEVGIGIVGLMREMIETRGNFVLQCPALCRYCHRFAKRHDLAVVLMRRRLEDILASQKRIKWGKNEKKELLRYNAKKGPVAKVKYDFWERYQTNWIWHPFEIEYESLSGHPMWVPKGERKDFTPGQTEAGKPEIYGPRSERKGVIRAKQYQKRR